MKTVIKTNWLSEAKKFLLKTTGKTINSIINELKEKGCDEYGIMEYKIANLRLHYTSNKKFAYGGKGWYLSNKGLSGGSVYKLRANK